MALGLAQQPTGVDSHELRLRRRRLDQVVERGRPGGVLGQEAGARLFERPQRLVQRRPKGSVDRHDLAGRLHLAAERSVGRGELVEREARQLDHHVVQRRLEGRDRGPGHDVWDLRQPPTGRDLGRDARDRIARRLARQRGGSADARVDLDDRVIGVVRRERELDVAAALHPQRSDDRQGRGTETLVDRVRQSLDRRDHDRVASMDAQRVDILHRADGDAGVVRVAHDLVFDLLPADQTALDHDLVDGAESQARARPLPVGRLGLDDAATGSAHRESRPDDRRQADLRECRVGGGVALLVRLAFDDVAGRIRLADSVEEVAEQLAVLGHLDRLERRADQPDVVLVQDAGLSQGHGQVEPGLAAQAGEEPLRPLFGDDSLDGLDGERLEVDGIGHFRVGHDRGRIGVDQDRPHALGPQRPAGLCARVVELGRLPDDHGATADDQRALGLDPLGARGRVGRDWHCGQARGGLGQRRLSHTKKPPAPRRGGSGCGYPSTPPRPLWTGTPTSQDRHKGSPKSSTKDSLGSNTGVHPALKCLPMTGHGGGPCASGPPGSRQRVQLLPIAVSGAQPRQNGCKQRRHYPTRISRRSRCDLTGTSTRQSLVRFYEILPRLKDQTGTAFESALKGQQGP